MSLNYREISYVINGKSDIIVSFDEEYLAPVISQKKTYEFRSWRTDPEVKRMWIYVNRPIQSLMYIFELDPPVEYPNQIPNDNTYNEMFNQGKNVKWKFAYRIKHLYKLNDMQFKDCGVMTIGDIETIREVAKKYK